MKKSTVTFMAILSCVLLFPVSAHAYLDAGSGSYILQVILALVLSSGFLLKSFWIKIINSVAGLFTKKANNETS